MLGVIDLEPILEDQFCFLGGGPQFRMSIDVPGRQDGIGHAPQAVLQFSDALHDLGRGRLRLDVGIECDFTLDLLNVFGDGGFAVVYWMDDPRKDTCQWTGIRHGKDYKSEIRQVESLAVSVAKRALPIIRAHKTTMQPAKLVVVQSYGTRAEADLAKGALEDADIQAMIEADTAGGMREHLAWSARGFEF
jgi:hypothetical protein